jgi:hypothetical protein
MPEPLFFCPGRRTMPSFVFVSLLVFVSVFFPRALTAQRARLAAPIPNLSASGAPTVDLGVVPSSQPLELTLRLSVTADRSAALDEFLSGLVTSSSSSYHQWLTPQQFATQFGATDDQVAAATAWLQAQGLTVTSVSPAKTRVTVSGTAAQVQSAFAVTVHRYQSANAHYFANVDQPSVPQAMAAFVAGVSGLDDMPAAAPTTLATYTSAGPLAIPTDASQSSDPLSAAAAVVDANAASILTFTTAACSTDLTQSDYDAYHDLFRQANAQGITVLATSGCGSRSTGSFPASLGEVTALTVSPTASPFVAIAARPAWQSAPGLPDDTSRDEADLTTTSVSDFAQTLTTILQRGGTRQGNINSTLYALAPSPGLYTQPDATSSTLAGTWEAATGLGMVDLAVLAKDFPLGTSVSTTSISSSNYAPTHGQSFTLTAVVTAASGSPSGTVTFSSTQGGALGSASLNSAGVATYTTNQLPAGAYGFSASYSGDATYASSNSGVATVTIEGEVSQISATVVSGAVVGGNVTLNVTVVSASGVGTPGGSVTVVPQGTGTTVTYTGALTTSAAHAASATVSFPATQAGSITLLVNCSGDVSFTCYSPVSVQANVAKAVSTTLLTIVPNPPSVNSSIALTATIPAAGSTLATGTVTFMDGATVLSSVPLVAGSASYSETIAPGKHSFTATYAGDANFNASTSNALPESIFFPSGITLSSNVSSAGGSLAGLDVVFTATVFAASPNAVSPTGTVTLYDTFNGSVVALGSPVLAPNGPGQSVAVFSTTGLPAGTHNVYAIYNGDSEFNVATSSTLSVTLADYSVTLNPQTLTVSPGQSGQVVMQVGPLSGFTGTVTFACTPPANSEMNCSFSPVSAASGGSTTMTITSTAPVAADARRDTAVGRWNVVAGAGLAMLFCFAMPGRRRSLPKLLLLCVVCSAANFGCGNGITAPQTLSSPSTPSDPGTPLGTQIFTITTASSNGVGTIRHTYPYQVTVQ